MLSGIQVRYDGFDAHDPEPPRVPDVFAERPVVVVGKWRGEPKGEITVSGVRGGEPYRQTFQVAEAPVSPANAALRYLWARSRIAWLDDNNRLDRSDQRVQEVTDLGLKYNLLTAYTSFVAIDSAVRLKEGETATLVKQPLPLPESAVAMTLAAQIKPQALRYARGLEEALPKPAPTPSKPSQASTTTAPLKLAAVTILSGTLSAEAVQTVFAQDQALARCAAKAAKTRKHPRFVLTVTVDARGRVTTVKPATDQRLVEPWMKCVMEALKAWQLPVNGQAAEIRLEIEREP